MEQKTIIFALILFLIALLLNPSPGVAFKGEPIPPPPNSLPAVNPVIAHSGSLCLSCLKTQSPTIWKWHVNNVWGDQKALTRSPDNPESMVEYMLRTF